MNSQKHIAKKYDLLVAEPHTHLYQIERLENSDLDQTDDEWRAIYSNSQLIALSLSVGRWKNGGRSISTVASGDEEACYHLGEEELNLGGTELIMGPRSSSDAFFQGMECPDFKRFQDQRLLLTQIFHTPIVTSRCDWQTSEFEMLEVWAGQMLEEDMGTNPRNIDLETHRSNYFEKN